MMWVASSLVILIGNIVRSFAAVLHGIAQFIPVLGVPDAAYLSAIKWKTARKTTAVVLIAAILFLVFIFAWISWGVWGMAPWESFRGIKP
ncbi:MAG: hypothetical protein PHP22_11495 [Oscillospiraceae bacterium]|nr:hypothetical protein [Oscillospiraceae bacterium]